MTENKKTSETGFVICLKNEGYKTYLERQKIYRILHDPEVEKDGDLRIVDESGEDYLYPNPLFSRGFVARRHRGPCPEVIEVGLIPFFAGRT